jgi:indole-3-glycerol phosphate synthase
MSGAGDFLVDMAFRSRARSLAAQAVAPERELRARIKEMSPALPPHYTSGSFDLIAEVKLRSPAVGQLKPIGAEDIVTRVTKYANAGAAAVSVLTEPTRFDGSMQDLEVASAALGVLDVPAMRKDFLVDSYQVIEGRAAGASGVLAILRMLPRPVLEKLIDTALELGMFVLLEAFDETDIELANALVASRLEHHEQLLVGVNSRDLATLQVVPGRLIALADLLPREVRRVAESGVATPEDAARVAAYGYTMALVGSALMSAGDPHALAEAMLAEGRAAALARAPVRAPR